MESFIKHLNIMHLSNRTILSKESEKVHKLGYPLSIFTSELHG